jgi:hypothetical protein
MLDRAVKTMPQSTRHRASERRIRASPTSPLPSTVDTARVSDGSGVTERGLAASSRSPEEAEAPAESTTTDATEAISTPSGPGFGYNEPTKLERSRMAEVGDESILHGISGNLCRCQNDDRILIACGAALRTRGGHDRD